MFSVTTLRMGRILCKGLGMAAFFSLVVLPLQAQNKAATVLLAGNRSGPYKLLERSDWSRYDNGKYTGHVYREVRASLNPSMEAGTGALTYQGSFIVLEETLRDMRQSAQAVDDVIPVTYTLFPNGAINIDDDRGFPSLRGFPAFPAAAVEAGSKWTAAGSIAADPLHQRQPVVIPFTAEYEYRGTELYRDIPVHRISARYTLRNAGQGSGFIVQGNHAVDILLRVSDGLPLLLRDNMDETYTWNNGQTLRFRGFTLTFGEGAVPLAREPLIAAIKSGPDITVNQVPAGLRLTIQNLSFAPDSENLLPGETARLDLIAQTLKQAPDRTFLVEGHTAAIGNSQGEMDLSIRRAKKIAEELSSRGISADRFVYKGWGGTMPLGDNTSDEGRRQNRRVEITILE